MRGGRIFLPCVLTARKLDILRVDELRIGIRRPHLLADSLSAVAYKPKLTRHAVHNLMQRVDAMHGVAKAIVIQYALHPTPRIRSSKVAKEYSGPIPEWAKIIKERL